MPTTRTTCLVAPDKFKGSLDATNVALALRAGLRAVRPGVQVECRPMADGGDGTVALLSDVGFDLVPVEVDGPTGQTVRTSYAVRGEVAVVELADACGLSQLPDGVPAPLDASSYGLGQVIVAAVRSGCRHLVIGLGGSASTDGGAGLLQALGARVLDRDQQNIPRGGRRLAEVASVDLNPAHDLLRGVSVTVAADVDNPLLGSRGAAATYGPQKGADPAQVNLLEQALSRFATAVGQAAGAGLAAAPGAGAAGGVGFAALALGATIRRGIEVFLDLTDFATALTSARLVITGEGRLDQQSLAGKTPVGVAAAAHAAGVPVVAVAGQSTLDAADLAAAGFAGAYPLTSIDPDLDRCQSDAAELLTEIGRRIALDHLTG
ncbi:glycerate kinase [Solwaraspora sp. WMMA2101]|uniref:glycerate kinase n=1 Tax=Solwaraspora sp. WMMA2101 TaxID=3404124 RepID=UPI003B93D6B2